MNLINAYKGWQKVRKGDSIPGLPQLTMHLREMGTLAVTQDTAIISPAGCPDRVYSINLDGKPIGNYRVERDGTVMREMARKGSSRVARALFADIEDTGSYRTYSWEGNIFADMGRILKEMESIGRGEIYFNPELDNLVSRLKR